MRFPDRDRDATIKRYAERYRSHGYSPKSLGWDKGKQQLRFEILTSQYDFRGQHVLDIGCGFGDLNRTLAEKYGEHYRYTGIELVPDLLNEAVRRYERAGVGFIEGDFLSTEECGGWDFAIASGVFNHRLIAADNYDFIDACIDKALAVCRDGLAFDFLSDKVDFQLEHTFHSSPERILEMAYRYSRNVILRNDYMPFEFSVFIFNDDSFSADDTVFERYKQLQRR